MTIEVRPSLPADRGRISEILLGSGLFGPADADCVDEMFRDALANPTPDNYRFLSGWMDGEMMGFACYGWEALTQGTWDLFWVCTLPAVRGRGLGKALLGEAARIARAEGGRIMVIYTSSTAPYFPAHRLYRSLGFDRTATIPDYYRDGDDLHIYTRRLDGLTPGGQTHPS
jgi:ribosomal protein S18 acetylase RimI-like enzyme